MKKTNQYFKKVKVSLSKVKVKRKKYKLSKRVKEYLHRDNETKNNQSPEGNISEKNCVVDKPLDNPFDNLKICGEPWQ